MSDIYVTPEILNAAKPIVKGMLSAIAKTLKIKADAHLKTFDTYITTTYSTIRRTKTLYSGGRPLDLNEIYTEPTFMLNNDPTTQAELLSKLQNGERIIVQGNGGAGKTLFLKHLWLERMKCPNHRIPIFLELRRLNSLTTIKDISTFIRLQLNLVDTDAETLFSELCKQGQLEFIFDGFDELHGDNRKKIEQEILELSHQYQDCSFILTGRDDIRYTAWHSFTSYKICPLSFEQAKELLDKMPYEDTNVKKRFITHFTKGFYTQHKSFLSNPLLIAMMLITYRNNAEISNEITTFYDRAFSALWSLHDASKDGFTRQRSCSEATFKNILRYFCFESYYKQDHSFEIAAFNDYITRAIKRSNETIKAEDFIKDLCEGVNLLLLDGQQYQFIHRSFQEFFAAQFLTTDTTLNNENRSDVLEEFANRTEDSSFSMCYELNKSFVYKYYFKEKIQWLHENELLSKIANKTSCRPYLCEETVFDIRKSNLFLCTFKLTASSNSEDFYRIASCILNTQGTPPRTLLSEFSFPFSISHHLMKGFRTEDTLKMKREQAIKVVLSFDESDTLKVSLRNEGDMNVRPEQMAKYRAHVKSAINQAIKAYIKTLNAYIDHTNDTIKTLETDYECATQSMDFLS